MSSPPYNVRAVYDYKSPHDDDLSFPKGQIITVTDEEDAEWYVGEYTDASGDKQDGLFPRNFVERYEPEAPPRPVRSRPKREAVPIVEPEPQPAAIVPTPAEESLKHPDILPEPQRLPVEEPPAPASTPRAPEPTPAPSKPVVKAAPPPVVEKPSSFKDRIAAFNKASQAPLTPVKPGAPAAAGGFIKKPFVPPPPARDAYVPIPREAAPIQKLYRREEDPEIAERQAQDQEDAERAGLVPAEGDDGEEEAPKTTSLKDRIAALQKQQQEQAMRRAEMILNEKPKRPAKKRTESGEAVGVPDDAEEPELTKVRSSESAQRVSLDAARNVPRPPPGRKPSRDQKSLDSRPRETFSDANDADQSGAGETTEEAEGTSTEIDDSDEKPRAAVSAALPRTSMSSSHRDIREENEGVEDDEEEEKVEEEEMDAETRRKVELRERMAKMSGGMGMAGMFGPPGGVALPAVASRKKRPSGTSEQRPSVEETPATSPPTQRIPMMPVPGMHRAESPESLDTVAVRKEPEPRLPITSARPAEEVPDMEDIAPAPAPVPAPAPAPVSAPAPPVRTRTMDRAVPPVPQGNYSLSEMAAKKREDRRRSLIRSKSIDLTTRWTFSTYSAYEGAPVMQLTAGVRKRPVPAAPTSVQQGPAPPRMAERPIQSPIEARPTPPPPPPPQAPQSPNPESESEEEVSSLRNSQTIGPASPSSRRELPIRAPPPPIPITIPGRPEGRPEGPRSPPPSSATRSSYLAEPTSPTSPTDKRISRAPPVPFGLPSMSPNNESRAPPPPPPTAALPRRPTEPTRANLRAEDDDDHRESDYEGDYDTDIASGATHRDALTVHGRQPSLDSGNFSEDTSTRVPFTLPPPIPGIIQRGAPPPPPQAPPRQSVDAPRNMPPAPPPRDFVPGQRGEEYDAHRYSGPPKGLPITQAWVPDRPIQESDPSLYASPPQRLAERPPPMPPQGPPLPQGLPPPQAPPPQERAMPSFPQTMQQSPYSPPAASRQSREAPRQSQDVSRPPVMASGSRRSVDQSRPSSEQTYAAQDVDLSENSLWWAQPNTPPPVFQKRNDVLFEIEESSTSKRGGRTSVSKDIYVLFPDYSQTIITARFDIKDPADVALEQRHEAPPPLARQDKLEAAHVQFGPTIATAAASRANHTIGDGSAHAFVLDILRKQPGALLPVGTRAYGALVYANLANATVQQYDEIRPGDIISFRNAKFQGKHGAMHAKYSEDVGKPEHVGVVVEWDGTKKKIRAFEQGREGKRVKVEGFRVGDLRSGEVKVWRVMGRGWVGWEG